jgi:hypothetical protein
MIFYALVSPQTEQAVDLYPTREAAEAEIENVRKDDAELAESLRVEPVEMSVSENWVRDRGSPSIPHRVRVDTDWPLPGVWPASRWRCGHQGQMADRWETWAYCSRDKTKWLIGWGTHPADA